MNLLTKRKRIKTYIGEELKDKYLYFEIDEKRYKCCYIVLLRDIINEGQIVTYKVNKSKVFKLPHDKDQACYIFDGPNDIEINIYNVDVYEITWQEYIELFKKFIEYEAVKCKDVPEQLI